MWNRREEIIVLGSFALSPARNQMTSHLLLPEDKDSMSLQNSANICVNTENNNTNVFTATRTSVTVSTTDVWSCLVPPLSRLVLNVNTNILLCSVIERDSPSGDVNLSRCLGQTETIALSLKNQHGEWFMAAQRSEINDFNLRGTPYIMVRAMYCRNSKYEGGMRVGRTCWQLLAILV